MPAKKITSEQRKKIREENEILQAFAKENKLDVALTPQKLVLFALFGLSAVVVPTYFFQAAYKTDLFANTFNLILMAVVGIPAIVLLVQGYQALYKRQKQRMAQLYTKQLDVVQSKKNKNAPSKETLDAEKEKMSEMGATGYALWFTNVVFVLVSMIITRHILVSQSPRFSYPVGVLAGAFAARFLSTKTTNKRRK